LIIAKHDSEDIPLSWSTFQSIETMLTIATIDDKSLWIKRLNELTYDYQGIEMIEDLREYLPIMGFHRIPINVKEAMEATRIRVERDYFQEQRTNK
jgi:hypothetical protein